MLLVLSNRVFFPIVQFSIFLLFLKCAANDFRFRRRAGEVGLIVNRAVTSMTVLEKVTGLVLVAIVSVLNDSVFKEDAVWSHYSAFFDSADALMIIYACYFSPFGRNFVIGLNERLKSERR